MLPSLRQTELQNGDRMSREEFLWRWEQIPELKHAELIEGVVYLASPVSRPHGSYESLFGGWLNHYAHVVNQDFEIDHNTTLLLGDSAFQPDVLLIRPVTGETASSKYLEQVPDLAVEICQSSRSYDLGVKLAAYRSAGLREYIALLIEEQRVEWRVLRGNRYQLLQPSKNQMLCSPNFSGLWLDTQALFPPNRRRLFDGIDAGVTQTT